MAYYDTTLYCNAGDQSTTGYYAVAKWAATTAIAAGALRRQLAAPAVNSERVFVCIIAGTTGAAEPTWVLTRGAKTTDGTVTWMEVSGIAAVNGDKTSTVNWTQAKAIGTPSLGTIIQRANGASYWICTTAGVLGASEPAWPNDTAGTTQADSTTTWTCLGVVGNFTGGQAPHARLFSACAANWFAAGNTVYVGDNHAESAAALIQVNPTGSPTTIGKFICHNHSGSYPPASSDMTTGATVAAISGNSILLFNGTPSGTYYLYGLTFITNSTATSIAVGVNSLVICDRCSFQFSAVTNSSLGFTGSSPSTFIFNNTTLKFAGAGQSINITGIHTFIWQNTAPILVAGSTIPTAYLITGSGSGGTVVLEALDLSQISSSPIAANNWVSGNILIKDCKLSATLQAPAFSSVLMTEQLVRSDSVATGYKSARYTYDGTETTETSIVRTGGSVDPTGQAQSRKIVTTGNPQWLRPFKAEPYAIWNSTVGSSVTVTVCGTVNAGALPNNDDIWLEVEYLGSSASPLGTIVTTTKSNLLAANAAVASDSSVWGSTAISYVTWDPATVTNVTLSGGNLVATGNGTTNADQGAHVAFLAAQTSGKYYFEMFTNTVGGSGGANVGFGIGTTGSTYTNMGGSATFGSMLYNSGNVWSNGSNSGVAFGIISSPTLLCAAVDLDNRKIWFRVGTSGNWNNNVGNSPVTNVGGVTIPAGSMVPFCTFGGSGPLSGIAYTADFGASAFSGVVPSGFTPGWYSAYTPFKLATTITPQLPGYIHARVRAAKASTTYYIDPQVTLS